MLKLASTLLVLISLNSSCFLINCVEGEGKIIEKKLKIETFNKLSLNGSHKVFLSQGNNQSVMIKAQENIIQLLNQEVSKGKWNIEFEQCVKTDESIEFYVTVVDLKELEIDGSGSIMGKTPIKTEELDLEVNGSGEMILDLFDVKELESEINGSGDLKLSGNAKDHIIEINGSGDVKAFDLKTDQSRIEINGSGDVDIHVSYELEAEINGSGDISYKGSVKNLNTEVNGSGDIKQLN